MKITAYEEYGLRILLRIAKIQRANPCSLVSLQEIADAEGISVENTAAILAKLKDSALVKSVRGKYGGYKLANSPCKINLQQVIQGLAKDAFADDFCEQHSGVQNSCVNSTDCAIRPVWNGLNVLINNFLSAITLEQLMNDEHCSQEQIAHKIEVILYGG
jgi:Rrf2 family transcriptional regulator, iron-sulfur cluster assembly transcription factor